MTDPVNSILGAVIDPIVGVLLFVVDFVMANFMWFLLGVAWLYFGYYIWITFKEEKENEDREKE